YLHITGIAVADRRRCYAVPGSTSAHTRVPSPGGLSMPKRPPRAAIRAAGPRRPEPLNMAAPPTPSSATSMRTTPFARVARIVAGDAPEYLATLVSDSATT